MTTPLFSVVIPLYNYADVVVQAIESVLTQDGENFELIVINDGSTDKGDEVVQHHLQQHAGSYRYISQPNAGVSAARNRGIAESRGQYLIFLDADDELTPHALRTLAGVISKVGPVEGIIIGGHITRTAGRPDQRHHIQTLPTDRKRCFVDYIHKRFSVSNGAVAIHRTVFDKVRYCEGLHHAEDIPVFGQILANFPAISVDEPLAVINKHADSRRHDADAAERTGLQLVEQLFDPDKLPPEFMQFEAKYKAIRCLSVFRTLLRAGRPESARKFFLMAAKADPVVLFRWSYTKKFVALEFKRLFSRPRTNANRQ